MNMPKIIAVDVGHCENVATYPVELENNNAGNNKGGFSISSYCLQGKNQIMSSQIFLTNEQMAKLQGKLRPSFNELRQLGEIFAGDNIPVNLPDGELFCYFKVPPKDFDKPCGRGKAAKIYKITHGQIMACFNFVLLNNIFKFNESNLSESDREKAYLLIGCPSTKDWDGSEYANLVKRAVKVKEAHIVPESRAAMFSSVSNKKNPISAVDGAIVFDFGSSTADCTYMLLGRKRIEFSYALGASEIERNMTLFALNEAVERYGEFEISPIAFTKVENKMREMKEKFYNKQVEIDGDDISCRFATSPKIIKANITIDEDFMRQMTEEQNITIRRDSQELKTGSWRSLVREFFQEARGRINGAKYFIIDANGVTQSRSCPVSKIVLTGGASNMDFIYEECKAVFNNIEITRESNTSYTVATGLSWAAIADLREAECINNAIIKVKSEDSCKIETLRTKVSDKMFAEICNIVEEKTKEWANISGDVSAGVLKNNIDAYIATTAKKRFSAVCKTAFDDWKDNLANNICDAVNAQAKTLFSDAITRGLMMPRDLWKQLQPGILKFDNIDLSAIFTELDMGGILNQIAKYAVTVIIWTTAGVMAPETLGASLLIALFAQVIAEVIITDDDLTKPRSQKIREKVAAQIKEKLSKKKDEIMKDFNQKLADETSGFDAILKELVTSAFEIVTLKKF